MICYKLTNISNQAIILYSTTSQDIKINVGESIFLQDVSHLPSLLNLLDPSLGLLIIRKEVLIDG